MVWVKTKQSEEEKKKLSRVLFLPCFSFFPLSVIYSQRRELSSISSTNVSNDRTMDGKTLDRVTNQLRKYATYGRHSCSWPPSWISIYTDGRAQSRLAFFFPLSWGEARELMKEPATSGQIARLTKIGSSLPKLIQVSRSGYGIFVRHYEYTKVVM